MGLSPTYEQQVIIDAAIEMVCNTNHETGAVKAIASAGAGKTSVLIAIVDAVQQVFPNAKILYLAFNKALAEEAVAKFGDKAEALTMNAVALRNLDFGKQRREIGYITSQQFREILGSGLSDSELFLTKTAISNYLYSSDDMPTEDHVPARRNGIVVPAAKRKAVADNVFSVFTAVMPPSKKSPFPIPHDMYLKYWQLIGAPGLEQYDLVMLDEAQDGNGAFLAALEGAGNAIYVGDSHQAIYKWRNTVDGLKTVFGKIYPMTQSFRYGPVIANLANEILSRKKLTKLEYPVKGYQNLTTSIMPVDRNDKHTRIYRTNRGLIREALLLKDRGIEISIFGNKDNEFAQILSSAWALKIGDHSNVRHKLCRWLKTWDKAIEMAEKEGESKDLTQAVRLIEEFSDRVPEIIGFLVEDAGNPRAKVVLTTAHKSKGQEWDNVIIAADFDPLLEKASENKSAWDSEMNLLYVAVTRAMKTLEIQSQWLDKIARGANA